MKLQYLWPSDAKNSLIEKDPDAGEDGRQEEKGMTEDEMVGGDHQLDGHEFEQAPEVGDRQGRLAYCSPWGCSMPGFPVLHRLLEFVQTQVH